MIQIIVPVLLTIIITPLIWRLLLHDFHQFNVQQGLIEEEEDESEELHEYWEWSNHN